MKPQTLLLFIFLAMVLSACSSSSLSKASVEVDGHTEVVENEIVLKTPGSVVVVSRTPDLTPTILEDQQVPTIRPTLSDHNLRPKYDINAVLDYGWRILTVEEEIMIPNASANLIPELILVVQPNWRPDVFNLTDIAWGNGEPVRNYTLNGIQLHIMLENQLDPGEFLQLFLSYEIKIPPILDSENFGPNPFGYTSRQINFTDWYPFVPPYVDGTGWLVHNPWYYGEHLVYPVADFDVMIKLVNAPPETLVAASSLDLDAGDNASYHIEKARNFVWSVSPEYQVFEEQVGITTVLGYAFPFDTVPGEAAFDTTVEALQLYNQLFGPYPFNAMTQVQADFDHGMEYTGFYFLSKAFYNTYDGTPSSYLVAIAAHETAHQWWYGLVGNDQAMEPWLDEALCTYSEKLFYENLYPQSLEWWDYTRVNYYEPEGWVDSTIYNTISYRAYRDAVYLQGALFIDELRQRIGDEDFFSFLKDYINNYSYQQASSDDFFSMLKNQSDVGWDDLITIYFENH
jgi:hypothetical protein